MNIAKIAAALHAFADALVADVEAAEQTVVAAVTGKKGRKAAAEPAAPAAPVTEHIPTATTTPPATPVTPPTVVTITKDQLNKVVLAVAAKERARAEAILAKFGHKNTVTLPPEQYQAVFDAFEEELEKINAASVQIAQASLV